MNALPENAEKPPSRDDLEMDRDTAGLLGLVLGIATFGCLLLGVLIPLIPWLLAGVLGLLMVGCACFSTSRLKWPVLWVGLLALLPTLIFLAVELLPRLRGL